MTPDTLVWHEGMVQWRPYHASGANAEPLASPGLPRCAECGKPFPEDEVVAVEGVWVCAGCKPVFLQKMWEGVWVGERPAFAGFWIRVLAAVLDEFLRQSAKVILVSAFMKLLPEAAGPSWTFGISLFAGLLGRALDMLYETWFVGKFGATPGKMACGLRVVRPDGSPLSYPRALARYWAKVLNFFTLMIGFVMIAFDEEKRGLHDRICDTRVVWD